ncbi:MAG: chromate efflux transporter [Alphaproteobacteria bacterium]|nr:chromate efflux transporter [Alphaproteobacteria bacterium]
MAQAETAAHPTQHRGSPFEVLRVFLRLGLTSFGGPVAHLGYFRAEFVERRRWLNEAAYADIVALCQFLPGPASSQTGISIGILRAGLPGALCAWLGFTTPSAVAMVLFGYGVAAAGNLTDSAWLHGLKIVAVAVVAQAVWGMSRNLCPDRERATIAVAAAMVALAIPSAPGQIGAIAGGALIGRALLRGPPPSPDLHPLAMYLPRRWSVIALAVFFALLLGLPPLAGAVPSHTLALVASFYRSGALVFGGGHVVLPLLQSSVVPPGWVTNDAFLAGYGAAQAVPGPLFTFAAYLGTVMGPPPNGWLGGLICVVAIFAPSFLLLIGALPFWDTLRRRPGVQSALRGVNAAVVGLLLAALYRPVWTSAVFGPADFAIAILAFLLLTFWAAPPWLVVIFGAVAASVASVIASSNG